MKKIILFVLAFVSFSVLTSCSSDDDGASLEGKWEYFKEGTATDGQEFLQDYVHQAGCSKDYSMITASSIMDHTFSGSTCTEEISTIPYTRSGNTITTTFDGSSFTAQIKTLNENTLKVYFTDPDFPGEAEVTVFKRVN